MGDVTAEATSTTEAGTTAVAEAEKPVVAAQPQEAGAAKTGQKPETKAAESKPKQAEAKSEAKPDAAKADEGALAETKAEPVELEFRNDKGEVIDDPATKAFLANANELKLTPEIATKQRDRLLAGMSEAKKAAAVAWEKELRADKDFGGTKFDESVGLIKTTLERMGDVGAAAQKFLAESGLERQPHIARLLHAFGKAISPDKFTAGAVVTGRPGDIPNPNDTSAAGFATVFKTPAAPQQ